MKKIETIVYVGKFGPPSLAFARSCYRQGVSVHLLQISEREIHWQSYSSCISGGKSIDPKVIGTSDGIDQIKSYAESVGAEAIIGSSDTVLLWLTKNVEKFSPHCKLLMPPYEILSAILSKEYQIKIAKEVGLEMLPTWFFNNELDFKRVPKAKYPICVRPSNPDVVSPVFKAKVLYSPEELSAFLKTFQKIGEPIIGQPFYLFPDMKILGARSEDGKILVMKPFLVPRKFEGVTLTLERIDFSAGLESRCNDFVNKAQLTGCFSFDFLYNPKENTAYYLEINARLVGITDKAMHFGYDQPAFFLTSYGFQGKISPEILNTKWNKVVNKRAVLKHIVTAIRGKLNEMDYPSCGRLQHAWKSLIDLITAKDSVFDWRDLRGTRWFYFQGLTAKSFRRSY